MFYENQCNYTRDGTGRTDRGRRRLRVDTAGHDGRQRTTTEGQRTTTATRQRMDDNDGTDDGTDGRTEDDDVDRTHMTDGQKLINKQKQKILLESLQYDIGNNILILQFLDHRKAFPDTNSDIPPDGQK